MDEFNDRMSAQREILRIVNQLKRPGEQLCGMSAQAIDRWVLSNRLENNSRLVLLIRIAAKQLFFLASKSQEQVSEKYRVRKEKLAELAKDLRELIESTNVVGKGR